MKQQRLLVNNPVPISEDDARRLYEAANEPKAFLELRGDHNAGFVLSGEGYAQGLDAFLSRYLR